MKKYLEIGERAEPGQGLPDFLRIEITDKTDSETAEIKKAMLDVLSGTVKLHICGHEDRQACVFEKIV